MLSERDLKLVTSSYYKSKRNILLQQPYISDVNSEPCSNFI